MRMNISVPDRLKKRMDALVDEDKANWSALAVAAFEQYLAELADNRKERNMSSVIDRLRGTMRKRENADTTAGRKAGREWAELTATAAKLRRLDEAQSSKVDWGFFKDIPHRSAAQRFVYVTDPEQDGNSAAPMDFWADICDPLNLWTNQMKNHNPDPAFVQGFAEGAMEVWNSVKDEI